jgi:hypothetical protein
MTFCYFSQKKKKRHIYAEWAGNKMVTANQSRLISVVFGAMVHHADKLHWWGTQTVIDDNLTTERTRLVWGKNPKL